MTVVLQKINGFFFSPTAIEPLGAFRIAISFFALVQALVLIPDWMWFFGPEGLMPWEVSDSLSTSNTPSLSHLHFILSYFKISPRYIVYLATSIYFLALISLLLGYKTRVAGFMAWFLHMMLNTTGHFTAYGVETFTHIALFYCAVLPVGVCWSLDSHDPNKSNLPPHLLTLSIRVVQLHLCVAYTATGLEKSMGEQWWSGEAIWIALQQDQFNQFNMEWLVHVPWLMKLLCWGTVIMETTYPIGMFWNKTKRIYLPGIICMHFFIAIFLGLHLFGLLMILFNLSIFGEHAFPGLLSKSQSKN